MQLETMKVVNPNGGFTIINVSDFDPDIYTKWTDEPKITVTVDKEVEVAVTSEPEAIDISISAKKGRPFKTSKNNG